MNLLKLSWKNLTYKPLNMMLSLVLFALGTGLVALLLLLNTQLQKQFEQNLAGVDLVIGAKGSPLQLILSSMYHIDAPTGNISVKEAKPFLNPKHPLIKDALPLSMGDSYQGYRIIGTTYEILEFYKASIAQGKLWEKTFEVTLGAKIAQDLKLKIGDEFKSSHGFVIDDNLTHDDASSFIVVGILESTGSVIDQLILTDTRSVWEVHDHGAHEASEEASSENHNHDHDHDHAHGDHDHHDHASPAPASPKSFLEEPDQQITALLLRFKNRGYQSLNMQRNINENTDLQAATPAIEINRLYSMMGVGTDTLQVLALVIVFVSALSVFIALFSSLKERKYELALMRVSGASRGTLFSLLILEGVLLAILGCILGLILSHGSMSLLSDYLEESYRYPFTGWMFLREEVWLIVGALIIGFVAALIPAIQASKTDISETLTSS